MTKEEAIEELKVARLAIKGNPNVVEKEFEMYSNAIDMAIFYLEKQIPKKAHIQLRPHFAHETCAYCPVCGNPIEDEDVEGFSTFEYPYCRCGQKIDWSQAETDREALGDNRSW